MFVKGMVKLGDFALGGLAGYVIGIFVAQFLASNILETQLARYLFVAAFCAAGGYWVMANPTDRYLIIAALIAGAFSLIYGSTCLTRSRLFCFQIKFQ